MIAKLINTLLFGLLSIISFECYSLSNNSFKGKRDYPIFIFGPELGGNLVVATNYEEDTSLKFQYTIGAFLNLRPIQSLGIESGLKYCNIISTQKCYEIPASFFIYSRSGGAFIIGPNFLFPLENGQYNLNNKRTGFTLGFGHHFFSLKYKYYPALTAISSKQDFKYFVHSLGLTLQFGIFSK